MVPFDIWIVPDRADADTVKPVHVGVWEPDVNCQTPTKLSTPELVLDEPPLEPPPTPEPPPVSAAVVVVVELLPQLTSVSADSIKQCFNAWLTRRGMLPPYMARSPTKQTGY